LLAGTVGELQLAGQLACGIEGSADRSTPWATVNEARSDSPSNFSGKLIYK
jgi:hypothetical protein